MKIINEDHIIYDDHKWRSSRKIISYLMIINKSEIYRRAHYRCHKCSNSKYIFTSIFDWLWFHMLYNKPRTTHLQIILHVVHPGDWAQLLHRRFSLAREDLAGLSHIQEKSPGPSSTKFFQGNHQQHIWNNNRWNV